MHVGTSIEQCVANNERRLRRRAVHTSDGLGSNAAGAAADRPPTAMSETTVPDAATSSSAESRESDARNESSGRDGDGDVEDLEDPYSPELLKNLIFRYEEPSTHSRWDKPLFTVPWTDPAPPATDIWTALTGLFLGSPAAAGPTMNSPSTSPFSNLPSGVPPVPVSNDDNEIDGASVATARTTTTVFTTATKASTIIGRDGIPRPRIKPHQATVQPTTTDSTMLYAFEKHTSAIVTAIRNFTLANPSAEAALARQQQQQEQEQEQNNIDEEARTRMRRGQGILISVPEAREPIFIPAHVARASTTDDLAGAGGILALPRLQRLRRQWIGLNRAYVGGNYAGKTGKGVLRAEQVGDAFVRFLNAEFAGEGTSG